MAHLREVRLIGAACAFGNSPRISARLRDVRSLGHERRGRLSHPARPHPLHPRTAGTALHRPGARRRAARRRQGLALRQDQFGQPGAASARPSRPSGCSPTDRATRSSRRASSVIPLGLRRSPRTSAISGARGSPGMGRRPGCSGRRPRTPTPRHSPIVPRTTATTSASSSRPRTRPRCPTSRPSPAS
jgi:hypothetical protein